MSRARAIFGKPRSAEQLRRWAVELADAADHAEWNVNDPGAPGIARLLFEVKGEIT